MLNVLIQGATPSRGHGITSMLGHLGAFGLFFIAIIDSSPLPTFGGPDILTAILAARQTNPWYEFVAVATAGSVIGAYLTFRIARKAGAAFLHSKFGSRKVDTMLDFFQKWGTGSLVASTAIPFPFPTSLLFAAAGASNYGVAKFLTVVTISRGARYTLVALVADHYGRHFLRILLHPTQHWGWLLLFAALILSVILAGVMLNKRLAAA
jgi:membrane protein YqaA with SNARE-associated domain